MLISSDPGYKLEGKLSAWWKSFFHCAAQKRGLEYMENAMVPIQSGDCGTQRMKYCTSESMVMIAARDESGSMLRDTDRGYICKQLQEAEKRSSKN